MKPHKLLVLHSIDEYPIPSYEEGVEIKKLYDSFAVIDLLSLFFPNSEDLSDKLSIVLARVFENAAQMDYYPLKPGSEECNDIDTNVYSIRIEENVLLSYIAKFYDTCQAKVCELLGASKGDSWDYTSGLINVFEQVCRLTEEHSTWDDFLVWMHHENPKFWAEYTGGDLPEEESNTQGPIDFDENDEVHREKARFLTILYNNDGGFNRLYKAIGKSPGYYSSNEIQLFIETFNFTDKAGLEQWLAKYEHHFKSIYNLKWYPDSYFEHGEDQDEEDFEEEPDPSGYGDDEDEEQDAFDREAGY